MKSHSLVAWLWLFKSQAMTLAQPILAQLPAWGQAKHSTNCLSFSWCILSLPTIAMGNNNVSGRKVHFIVCFPWHFRSRVCTVGFETDIILLFCRVRQLVRGLRGFRYVTYLGVQRLTGSDLIIFWVEAQVRSGSTSGLYVYHCWWALQPSYQQHNHWCGV